MAPFRSATIARFRKQTGGMPLLKRTLVTANDLADVPTENSQRCGKSGDLIRRR